MWTIKENLPMGMLGFGKINYESKVRAKNAFVFMFEKLSKKHSCKMFFRDTADKPMRGQLQVEVNGFYYYVELFIKNE